MRAASLPTSFFAERFGTAQAAERLSEERWLRRPSTAAVHLAQARWPLVADPEQRAHPQKGTTTAWRAPDGGSCTALTAQPFSL